MKRFASLGVLGLSASLLGGCDQPKTAPAPVPAATTQSSAASGLPTRAQPRLRTVKLWLGAQEVVAEVARTEQEIRTGMMFRESMGENEGMLFVFPGPTQTGFWMKNVTIPLSCAYMDSEGVILELHDLTPGDETPVESATANVQYVLEMPQGWFEKHGIGVGTLVRTDRGSFAQTFFGRP